MKTPRLTNADHVILRDALRLAIAWEESLVASDVDDATERAALKNIERFTRLLAKLEPQP